MKHRAELDESDIKDALRAYVEGKTGGTVPPNGIRISFSKAPANDPREQDSFSASIGYEKP